MNGPASAAARTLDMAAGDVAPLTRWAKPMMMLQSAISVAAIALVIAARSTFSADRRKHDL